MGVTPPSSWSWQDHRASDLTLHTWRPIQTRFRYAYTYRFKLACKVNSRTHYTKGTQSRNKSAPTVCMHPVSGLFHSPLGVLFTFPSQYWFTIGRSGVFSLRGWSPYIQTGFHVSRPTQGLFCFLLIRGYHPLWRRFPTTSNYYKTTTGLFRVRSPLLTESRLMSFPPGTEMFHFPGFASLPYVFR